MPRGIKRASMRGEKPRVVKAGTSPRGTSFGKGQKITKGVEKNVTKR